MVLHGDDELNGIFDSFPGTPRRTIQSFPYRRAFHCSAYHQALLWSTGIDTPLFLYQHSRPLHLQTPKANVYAEVNSYVDFYIVYLTSDPILTDVWCCGVVL